MQYQPPPSADALIMRSTTTAAAGHYHPYIPPTHPHYYYYYNPSTAAVVDPLDRVAKLASQNAVVIFSLSTCCMCYAIKSLFSGMGVNPTVYELDEDPVTGKETQKALVRLMGSSTAVPVVFIGGKLVGSMDRVMAAHISGMLVPLLKKAGALWL